MMVQTGEGESSRPVQPVTIRTRNLCVKVKHTKSIFQGLRRLVQPGETTSGSTPEPSIILNDINLTIPCGSLTAIMGRVDQVKRMSC